MLILATALPTFFESILLFWQISLCFWPSILLVGVTHPKKHFLLHSYVTTKINVCNIKFRNILKVNYFGYFFFKIRNLVESAKILLVLRIFLHSANFLLFC